jgi:hypothetical protein
MKLYWCRLHNSTYCEAHAPLAGSCRPGLCSDNQIVTQASPEQVSRRCPSCSLNPPVDSLRERHLHGLRSPAEITLDEAQAYWEARRQVLRDGAAATPFSWVGRTLAEANDEFLIESYGTQPHLDPDGGLVPWRDGSWVNSDDRVFYGGARGGGKSAAALAHIASLPPGSRVLAVTPAGSATLEVRDPRSIAEGFLVNGPTFKDINLVDWRNVTLSVRAGDIVRVNGVPLRVLSTESTTVADYLGPMVVPGWPGGVFVVGAPNASLPEIRPLATPARPVPGWPEAEFVAHEGRSSTGAA